MKNVLRKIGEIQWGLKTMTKDAKGQRSQYLTYDKMVEVLRPLLEEKKCCIIHTMDVSEQSVKVVTNCYDVESGEVVPVCCLVPQANSIPAGSSMQDVGAKITYGKRYNLGSLFFVATEKDTDAAKPVKVSSSRSNNSSNDFFN